MTDTSSVFVCFPFDYWLSCWRPQNAMMQPLNDTSEPGPQHQCTLRGRLQACHWLIVWHARVALVCERAVNGAFVLESGQQELIDSQDFTVCLESLILAKCINVAITVHGETQFWTKSAAFTALCVSGKSWWSHESMSCKHQQTIFLEGPRELQEPDLHCADEFNESHALILHSLFAAHQHLQWNYELLQGDLEDYRIMQDCQLRAVWLCLTPPLEQRRRSRTQLSQRGWGFAGVLCWSEALILNGKSFTKESQ